MKRLIILVMTALTASISVNAQKMKESIEETVLQFVKASSDRDVHDMYHLLHERFQSAHRTEALTKTEYMKLLGDRKLGGEDQKAEILFIDVAENSASVKVRISGIGGTTESYIHLNKNDLGSWQILHILPFSYQKA
jgi:Putative lumazine-binding